MIITFLIFLVMVSILITVHEFGHFIMARKMGVRVEKFSLGFGKSLLKKKTRETEFILSAIPFGGYVKLAGDNLEECKGSSDEYYSQPPGKRFNIIFFGPFLNYLLGFFCFWLIFVTGYPIITTKVGGLLPGYGAEKAGIQVGDVITAVDSKKVDSWEALQALVQSKETNARVLITVMRDNTEKSVSVSLTESPVDDDLGAKRKAGLLGISSGSEVRVIKYGPVKSIASAFEKSWQFSVTTYKAIWRMLTGRMSLKKSLAGPLGMLDITSKIAPLGISALIEFLAFISINLCIFNLLPIPILDGGHIMLLGLEKVRGKALSLKTERAIGNIGYVLLISLAVYVTYLDIVRLFGAKIAQFIK